MKSNRDLGFDPCYGELSVGFCDNRSMENSDVPGTSLSMHIEIGVRNGAYRVYGYLWHNEQDASREETRGECCARGDTARQAMDSFRGKSLDQGWRRESVATVLAAMDESLAEYAE